MCSEMMAPGAAVKITFGPFAGSHGVIVSTRLKRLVVRIRLNQSGRSVLVELDRDMVERAE